MKVKDLIEQLQAEDLDATLVCLMDDGFAGFVWRVDNGDRAPHSDSCEIDDVLLRLSDC